MAVEDNVKAASLYSHLADSLEPNLKGDIPSHEDLAWADSCLVEDPEFLDTNWSAVKDALLEIVDSHPEALSISADGIKSTEATDMDIVPPTEEAGNAQCHGRNSNNTNRKAAPANLKQKKLGNSYEINKQMIAQLLEDSPEDDDYVSSPSVPIYKDIDRSNEVFDSGLGSDIVVDEIEPLSDDIFKVWELNPLSEETERSKLMKDYFHLTPPEDQSSQKMNDVSPVKYIVGSFADLSLSRSFV